MEDYEALRDSIKAGKCNQGALHSTYRSLQRSDHIFTLGQILRQSKEWNASLYARFIDFEKAFDSIHQDSLWKIMRHYGIPSKLVNVIKVLYTALTAAFSVTSSSKQGCILSPFLFILAIDLAID